MRINHNISSMITQNSLFSVGREMSKSLERLSTGLRINRASDDAAGLGVSENLRTQVKGTSQAKRNAQDGIAAITIAEGAANEISSILQRMRELAVQS
ncbi:MAG: flagellin, partial [Chitinispirillaceae bacterium]|nr:flagellin [Chitinispirillaceae bacterium]